MAVQSCSSTRPVQEATSLLGWAVSSREQAVGRSLSRAEHDGAATTVVHFNRLKPCPPDVRIPDAATRTRPLTTTPPPTPPLGTTLEFLDCPEPEIPPTPRYPRRERTAPDRYQPGVDH